MGLITLRRFALATLGLLLVGAGPSEASPVVYVATFAADGELGATSFVDSLVTLTFVGDTANIFEPIATVFANTAGTATVEVAGVGTATFTGTVGVFSNQTGQVGGFVDTGLNRDLVDIGASEFGAYDLSTSISIDGTASSLGLNTAFGTSVGDFVLRAVSGGGTFSAEVTPSVVPEPSTAILAAMGGAGLLGYGWRRRRRA
jgi:hypothetical protein